MRYPIFLTGLALILSMSLAACQQSPTTTDSTGDKSSESTGDNINEDFIELGQKIVKTRCAFCHNTTTSGDSPRTDAPPLRTVLANYNPDALADDFREGLQVGHPDMPDFNFSVKEVDGLLAYLISIQEPQE
ncbi:MAG: cytochrome c [Acidimicrobiales bacterium]|nr:cytochrome c [Hyphomonadaceae bacterium]RZV35405.1 MAG: cytochrome c [Acidimicrobiales bacterium]